MTGYFFQRLLLMIPTFIGITLIVFLIVRLAPGDPAELRAAGGLGAAAGGGISVEKRGAVDEAMAQWRAQYGLDKPLYVQYAVWLKNIFTLSFGVSFKDSQPVWEQNYRAYSGDAQAELLVAPGGVFGGDPFGYLFGHASEFFYRSGDNFDRLRVVCRAAGMGGDHGAGVSLRRRFLLSLSRPAGWSRWMRRRIGPGGASSQDHAWHLFLPVVLLSYDGFAGLSRYMRSSMLEVLRQDYVQVASAKGLDEGVVVFKHVLRNSLIPQVTLLASILPGMIGGSVIIETIFSIPGLGQLGFESVLSRDYPVVLALLAVTSILTLIGILISDLLLAVVDPRIAFGRRAQ